MKNYVLIICRNCNNIQCYGEEYYNKNLKKLHCDCCGNGNTSFDRKDILKALKNDFTLCGLDKFLMKDYFSDYRQKLNKNQSKGFDIVKVDSND